MAIGSSGCYDRRRSGGKSNFAQRLVSPPWKASVISARMFILYTFWIDPGI